jgi:hypothetical protein
MRILVIIDDYTRKCLANAIGQVRE